MNKKPNWNQFVEALLKKCKSNVTTQIKNNKHMTYISIDRN